MAAAVAVFLTVNNFALPANRIKAAETEAKPPAGMKVWLRSDRAVDADAAGVVNQWGDISPNGCHAKGSRFARPVLDPLDTLYGLPGIRFDGNDDMLRHAQGLGFDVAGDLTIAVVCRLRHVTWPKGILALIPETAACDYKSLNGLTINQGSKERAWQVSQGYGQADSLSAEAGTGIGTSAAGVLILRKQNGVASLFWNDDAAVTDPYRFGGPGTANAGYVLGARHEGGFNHHGEVTIYEVLLYPQALSDTDITALRSYLSAPRGSLRQTSEMVAMPARRQYGLHSIGLVDTAAGTGPLGAVGGRLEAGGKNASVVYDRLRLPVPADRAEFALVQTRLEQLEPAKARFETVLDAYSADGKEPAATLCLSIVRSEPGNTDRSETAHLTKDLTIALAVKSGGAERVLCAFAAKSGELPFVFAVLLGRTDYALDIQPPLLPVSGEAVGRHGIPDLDRVVLSQRVAGVGAASAQVSSVLAGTARVPDLRAVTRGRRTIDPSDTKKWKLAWNDEFDGTEIDGSKWTEYGGLLPSFESQLGKVDKTNNNGDIDWRVNGNLNYLDGKGNLIFEMRKTAEGVYELPVQILATRQKFLFGYFEARVKFVTEPGVWSGFWMNPLPPTAVTDPFSTGWEMDILEDHMNVPRGDGSVVHQGIHLGVGTDHYRGIDGGHQRIANWSEFHTVGVEWAPLETVFYVDGKETGCISYDKNGAVSTVPIHVLMSLERRDPTKTPWVGDIRNAKLPDRLTFDYVQVYQRCDLPAEKPVVALDKPAGATCNKASQTRLDMNAGDMLTLTPRVTSGKPIRRAMLFDNGILIAEKPEVPAAFQVVFSREWFEANSDYFTPVRIGNGVMMAVKTYLFDHSLLLMVEDADGAVGYSEPVFVWVNPGVMQSERDRIGQQLAPGQETASDLPVKDGLVLWLRSDRGVEADQAGGVQKWNDLSGKNHSPIQDNADARPKLEKRYSFRNLPAIFFDGKNDFLRFGGGMPAFDANKDFTLVMVLRKEFDPELNEWPRRVFALSSSLGDDYDTPDAFALTLTEQGNPQLPGLTLVQDYSGAKRLSLDALLSAPDGIAQGAYVVVKRDREPNKGQARIIVEGESRKEIDYDIRPAGDKRHSAVTIGANPGGELNASLELYEIILYNRALDDAELAALDKYHKSWRGQ